VLCQFALTMACDKEGLAALANMGSHVAKTIEALEPIIERRVERYRFMNRCMVLGRGLDYATALEAALKLKETCALGAEAMSAADFLHGPIAAMPLGSPVILFAPDGPTRPAMESMLSQMTPWQPEVVCVSNRPVDTANSSLFLPVESTPVDLMWPIASIVPIQLLACHLAVTRGLDPDYPQGLSKVTQSGSKSLSNASSNPAEQH